MLSDADEAESTGTSSPPRDGLEAISLAADLHRLRKPAHSDFLVHWTGADILRQHSQSPVNVREYPPDVVDAFLHRLRTILAYGLWMTKRQDDDSVNTGACSINKPRIARLCFTELKVSDSMAHAGRYGPLGVGVKRPFAWNRLGSPVYYVPKGGGHLLLPPFQDVFGPDSPAFETLSFFKNMGSGPGAHGLIQYDLYEESEWRIIYSEKIREKLPAHKQRYFENPSDPASGKYHEYYRTLDADRRPEYIVPLDAWLALIIYPNPQIKSCAQRDSRIRQLLAELHSSEDDRNTGILSLEVENPVAELDLGAIRNF